MKIKEFIKKHWLTIFTLTYIISPIDLIPDMLAPIGLLDDGGVLLIEIINLIAKHRKKKEEKEKLEDETPK